MMEFTRWQRMYFKENPEAIYDLIEGKFITVNDKRLFLIKVLRSHEEPIVLLNQRRNSRNETTTVREFYIRDGTSTFPLYDAKDLIAYVKINWWRKKQDQS